MRIVDLGWGEKAAGLVGGLCYTDVERERSLKI